MGTRYHRSEGGSGGKLGRSHMGGHGCRGPHVKNWAKRLRRTNDRCVVEEGLDDGRCATPPAGARIEPAWRTADVIGLAAAMANSGEFTALPMLGDALMDAGCDNEFILDHCREAADHAHGCWLIDRLLRRGRPS